MKLAENLLVGCCLALATCAPAAASESAADCESAAATLAAGIEARPDHALLLFEDALQTNPGCRRDLLIVAIETSNPDAGLLEQIIYVARSEFPDEATLLAEAALSVKPDLGDVIKNAFFADEEKMRDALAAASETDSAPQKADWLEETRQVDDEIREAIARMNARLGGKPWPEQELSEENFQFKKRDAIRASPGDAVDESSLANGTPVDRVDEKSVAEHEVLMNDQWTPSDEIRLDESRFDDPDARSASTGPRSANRKSIATAGAAGAAGMPPVPTLPRSSVYYIPPASEEYHSTVDFEKDERLRPPLVIRSAPASPTSPK
ncbi:MAG: hypothetical protein WD342_18950 [Verrucomicrobiales bacterium]